MQQQQTAQRAIQALPKEVVDRIAAGEVIQRPSSVIKELIENSLDASSTNIAVKIEKGGYQKITISDNGCGIGKVDLPLAATRFATSKLKTFDDLQHISSFGFRGEALASVSLVGRLNIISKQKKNKTKKQSATAFTLSYCNGSPVGTVPKPTAGKEGTVVTVSDLFYNVPHRKTNVNEREEYNRILKIIQKYALHNASRGVSFVCSRKGSNKTGSSCGNSSKKKGSNNNDNVETVDLTTASDPIIKRLIRQRQQSSSFSPSFDEFFNATKRVAAYVYGSQLNNDHELIPLRCQSNSSNSKNENNSNNDDKPPIATTTMNTEENDHQHGLSFDARGFITSPNISKPIKDSPGLILFINDRLVESNSLKRMIDGIYNTYNSSNGTKKIKPLVYLDLKIPGEQVDVNVHPTKKEVALLYQDELYQELAFSIQQLLSKSVVQSFNTGNPSSESSSGSSNSTKNCNNQNQLLSSSSSLLSQTSNKEQRQTKIINDDKDNPLDDNRKKSKRKASGGTSENVQNQSTVIVNPYKKRKEDSSRKVRTTKASQVGAMEAYVVSKATTVSPASSQSQLTPTQDTEVDDDDDDDIGSSQNPTTQGQRLHNNPECQFYGTYKNTDIDLSVPGAFASAICKCDTTMPQVALPGIKKQQEQMKLLPVVVRNNNIVPTSCSYTSIQSLRKRICKGTDENLAKSLRESIFVGIVSPYRCLIQSGVHLLLWNIYDLSKELFYQIALAKFGGGADIATLCEDGGDGISVKSVLEEALHNDIEMAEQATSCLKDNAEMLEEYFSIRFECRSSSGSTVEEEENNYTNDFVLSGLPILLDGHMPHPGGLPLFLLRLATEVDWNDERACFNNVCKELALYYAEIPSSQNTQKKQQQATQTQQSDEKLYYVKHVLVPAISSLLSPPKELVANGGIVELAHLTSLYRAFER